MTESYRLVMQEDMNIYHTADQFRQINEALADYEALELDLSQVTEMDATGLQLLIHFKRESRRLGKEAHIVGHGYAVREAIDLTNLAAWLGDPIVLDGPAQTQSQGGR